MLYYNNIPRNIIQSTASCPHTSRWPINDTSGIKRVMDQRL